MLDFQDIIRYISRTEQDQVPFNQLKADAGTNEKTRYRTRYIFKNRQERRWFYIAWDLFIAVPSSVILWQMGR